MRPDMGFPGFGGSGFGGFGGVGGGQSAMAGQSAMMMGMGLGLGMVLGSEMAQQMQANRADGFQQNPYSEGDEGPSSCGNGQQQQGPQSLLQAVEQDMQSCLQQLQSGGQASPQIMQRLQMDMMVMQSLMGAMNGNGMGGNGMQSPFTPGFGSFGGNPFSSGLPGGFPGSGWGQPSFGNNGGSPQQTTHNSPTGPVAGPSNATTNGPVNNPTDFAKSLLQSLGAPQTQANIKSIVNWENREGGNWHNSASYNPLNTTQRMPGSSGMNGEGVQRYGSWNQGLQATVDTLNNGHYNDILSALHSGNGLSNQNLQGLSTWSGGAYSSV